MSKKIILSVFVVIIIVFGVYYYFSLKTEKKIIYQESAPTLTTPDINPVDKTNPFKNIKTNPFE